VVDRHCRDEEENGDENYGKAVCRKVPESRAPVAYNMQSERALECNEQAQQCDLYRTNPVERKRGAYKKRTDKV